MTQNLLERMLGMRYVDTVIERVRKELEDQDLSEIELHLITNHVCGYGGVEEYSKEYTDSTIKEVKEKIAELKKDYDKSQFDQAKLAVEESLVKQGIKQREARMITRFHLDLQHPKHIAGGFDVSVDSLVKDGVFLHNLLHEQTKSPGKRIEFNLEHVKSHKFRVV